MLISLMILPKEVWAVTELERYSGTEYSFRPDVRQMTWPEKDNVKGAAVAIITGTSQVLRFDRPITRTAISNAEVCDIVPLGRDEILVYSKRAGRMNLILWDEDDKVASYDIEATADTEKLEYLLKSVDAKSELKIVPFQQTVAIYGSTSTKQDMDRIEKVSKAFDPLSLNFVDIKNAKQVLLEVRFAEVNRRDNESFKLDAEILTRFFNMRYMTGQTGMSGSTGVDIDGQYPRGATFTRDGFNVKSSNSILQAMGNFAATYTSESAWVTPVLNWLETKNLAKIIARPNLLAKDGEEASFLVGGQFGYPVSSATGAVSVNYQDYGTKLTFTPEILKDELIRIKVNTEVSELDYANTVSIGSTTIPSVLKREQKTIAELRDNQTLVIGGMLTQRVNRINMKVPLLGDMPILKGLFASESFTRTDVELIVIITPHIVEPFQMAEAKQFYNAEEVGTAVRIIEPPYSDPQGDAVHSMMVQDEKKAYFDDQHEATANGRISKFAAPFTPSDAFRHSAKKPARVKSEDTSLPSDPSEGNRGYLNPK